MGQRKSNYCIIEKFQNVLFLFKTKVFYSTSRMIRFPFIVRGKKYIDFGRNLTTGRNCRIDVNGDHDKKVIVFGRNVNIGDNVRLSAIEKIEIGSNVLMGSRVLVIDNSHGSYTGEGQASPLIPPNDRELSSKPVRIGDNVWIGEGAVILPGACIGNGCVIGANSIVSKEIPDCCMVVGSNRIVKKWDKDSEIWERCFEK